MFGFNKKKKENKEKKQGGLDKILLGIVLGGAIGSVLGIGLAPKKGSDTRKLISKKANQFYKDAKEAVQESTHRFTDESHLSKTKSSTLDSKELPEE